MKLLHTSLIRAPLGPLIREVSSYQGVNNTYIYEVGTWSSVLIREMSLIQGCPIRGASIGVVFSGL